MTDIGLARPTDRPTDREGLNLAERRGTDPPAELSSIADELYALPPDRFTAERNAQAKAQRSAGDRALADDIAALPKPSASAWLANAIARAHADEIDQLAHIGDALRDAQETKPDREKLRQLAAARRQLIASVADLGAALAQDSGRSVSATVRDELEQTLGAALADPAAADALRTGRLVRALETDGVEPVDLDGALAGGAALPARRPSHARSRANRADEPEDLDARRRRKEAEAAVRAAEREHSAAMGKARIAAVAESAALQATETAEARRDELSERIDELQRELTQLRAELDETGDEVDAATRQAMAAGRQRTAAEREAAAADRETARLRSRLEKL